MGVQAAVLLPLRLRDSWVGLVELAWPEPRRFMTHDRRIFQSMATQLAVTLSNQQRWKKWTRSRQLEILSRVEADPLWQPPKTRFCCPWPAACPGANHPSWNSPIYRLRPTARGWRSAPGACATDKPSRPDAKPLPLELMPISALWLDKPRELLIIESARRDNRLNPAMRAQMEREGRRAAVVMPPAAGPAGGRVSSRFLGWPDSHELTADEAFILRRLHRTAGGDRRRTTPIWLQQAALARTEAALAAQARLSAELRAVSDVSLATAATL